jgi:hypothetical protein
MERLPAALGQPPVQRHDLLVLNDGHGERVDAGTVQRCGTLDRLAGGGDRPGLGEELDEQPRGRRRERAHHGTADHPRGDADAEADEDPGERLLPPSLLLRAAHDPLVVVVGRLVPLRRLRKLLLGRVGDDHAITEVRLRVHHPLLVGLRDLLQPGAHSPQLLGALPPNLWLLPGRLGLRGRGGLPLQYPCDGPVPR